jgi:hypothetical protein
MGRTRVDEAMDRARFSVREMTNSPVTNDHSQAEELHAQRLRDIGWDPTSGQEDAR